jgi:hypothetical protein
MVHRSLAVTNELPRPSQKTRQAGPPRFGPDTDKAVLLHS